MSLMEICTENYALTQKLGAIHGASKLSKVKNHIARHSTGGIGPSPDTTPGLNGTSFTLI